MRWRAWNWQVCLLTRRYIATTKAWEEQLRNADTKVKELTGIANLNSPAQIEAWLKRTLPSKILAQWTRTDGSRLSTEGKVLQRYAEYHPGLQAIAEYSKLRTLNTSFGLSLLDRINPL